MTNVLNTFPPAFNTAEMAGVSGDGGAVGGRAVMATSGPGTDSGAPDLRGNLLPASHDLQPQAASPLSYVIL